MNQREVNKITAWIEAAQKAQPEVTLGIFIYIRDGLIQVGRGDVPLEMKSFPIDDLPRVKELIDQALDKAFEAGPTDAAPDA